MNWDDLRVFLAIYRAGGASGAARTLGIQHSTVARRLTALEEAIGTSLFTRTPTGLVPTADARAVLPAAEDVERAMQIIAGVAKRDRLEGVVRLTTSEAFSSYLVRRLSKLQAAHPELMVEVLAGNRVFDLAKGEADLAIRIAPTTDPNLTCRRIGTASWALYASPSYIARRGTLSSTTCFEGHEVIGFDEGFSKVPGAQWLAEHARSATMTMRCNSIVAALNAAIAGLGIAAIPCFVGEGESAVRRVSPERIGSRDVWLVFHPDVQRIARVRCVIDFVVEQVASDHALLSGTS